MPERSCINSDGGKSLFYSFIFERAVKLPFIKPTSFKLQFKSTTLLFYRVVDTILQWTYLNPSRDSKVSTARGKLSRRRFIHNPRN